jgi:acetyl esterase
MPDDVVLHPEMQILIDIKKSLPPATTIEEMRAAWDDYSSSTREPYPDGMQVEDIQVPRDGGTVPVRVYRPAAAAETAPVVLYIHGGGFMKGDLNSSDSVAWGLSQETGMVVASIDYRLAPEHPYPAAFDDCYTVLTHVAGGGLGDGVDTGRIAICGDSAGGNLSAAVCLAARDRNGPKIAVQILIYPCLTDGCDTPAYGVHAETPGLTAASMHTYWDWYLAGQTRPCTEPYAVPLKASDLSGLPPAFVHIAEIDPLADDGRTYADMLMAAGVETQFRCADGMIHGFLRCRLQGKDSAREFASFCDFLKSKLG